MMFRFVLTALVCLVLVGDAIGQSDAEKAKAEVTKVNQEYVRVIVRQDAAGYDRLLSDDFVFVFLDGQVMRKAEILANAKEGVLTFDMAKSENEITRVYGKTAIVIGDWVEKGVFKGERFDRTLRYTTVFVKTGGAWKVVSDHVSEIKET